MFPPFRRLPPLPAVKDDRDRMILPVTIRGQRVKKRFAHRFDIAGKTPGAAQKIVAVDDKMRRHMRHATVRPDSLSMQWSNS